MTKSLKRVSWINADGTERVEDARKEPKLDELQKFVGGYIEHVAIVHNGKRGHLYVNETGALDALPLNEKATAIYRETHKGRMTPGPLVIFGPACLVQVA
jgi:hypothetical protein